MNKVEEYLIHSYLYYEKDSPIIDDYEFDILCKNMLKNFSTLKHKYLHLVDKDALSATSGHHLYGKFPEDIKEKAMKRLQNVQRRKTKST